MYNISKVFRIQLKPGGRNYDERTVITIGREFGSGGHEIGMKLAEKRG